jgi:GNAT superfamily N-acetyltransferase
MQIVKATPKHCKRIVELAKEGEIFNYTLLFYSLLIALGWIYVVLDDDNSVIAYTCYAVIPVFKAAFSFQTAVAAEHRSKKIGSELIDFTYDLLKKQGVKTIYAHCLKPRVVRLMERLGWEVMIKVMEVAFVRKKIR